MNDVKDSVGFQTVIAAGAAVAGASVAVAVVVVDAAAGTAAADVGPA